MVLLSRLFRLKMTLHNVLYISYMLPAEIVRPLLPSLLSLSLVEGKAFLSVVLFDCRDVRPDLLPVPSFNYFQLNVRTYAIDPLSGKQAVFFLKSGISSNLVSSLSAAISVPWQHIALDIQVETEKQPPAISYFARGRWGKEFRIRAGGKAGLLTALPPFGNARSAIDYLIMPLVGYYAQNDRLARLSIWHPWVRPQSLELKEISLPLLQEMNLLNAREIDQPHSTLFVQSAEFSVSLPPSWSKIA